MRRYRRTGILFAVLSLGVPQGGLRAGEAAPEMLRKLVHVALVSNAEIDVVVSDQSQALFREDRASSRFLPTWRTNLSYEQSTNPSPYQTDTFGGSFLIDSNTMILESGLHETLPTGTQIFTTFSTNRLNTSSSNTTIRPYYESRLTFGGSQPILSGFDWFGSKMGNLWNEYQVTRLNKGASQASLKEAVARILADVEFAFWNLLAARDLLNARKEALDLTSKQLDFMNKRIEAGLVVAAEAYQVKERIASRQGDVLDADLEYQRVQSQLLQLLNWPASNIINEIADSGLKLEFEDYSMTRDSALKSFEESNPGIFALRQIVESRRLEMLRQKNVMLPKMDVNGAFFLNGGNSPSPSGTGSYAGDLEELLRGRSHGFNVGFGLEVPLGPRSEYYDYRISRLAHRSAESRLVQEKARLKGRLNELFSEIESGRLKVATARETLSLAEKKLAFEQEKFQAGLTASFNMLQFQEDLTVARVELIRSLIAFVRATTASDAIVCRNLEKFRIRIEEGRDRWEVQQRSDQG